MYAITAQKIGKVVDEKNEQYGNAINNVSEILEVLYPQGIHPSQYHDAGAVIRVIDKLFRIANGNKGNENAWKDIAGYGILMSGKEEL